MNDKLLIPTYRILLIPLIFLLISNNLSYSTPPRMPQFTHSELIDIYNRELKPLVEDSIRWSKLSNKERSLQDSINFYEFFPYWAGGKKRNDPHYVKYIIQDLQNYGDKLPINLERNDIYAPIDRVLVNSDSFIKFDRSLRREYQIDEFQFWFRQNGVGSTYYDKYIEWIPDRYDKSVKVQGLSHLDSFMKYDHTLMKRYNMYRLNKPYNKLAKLREAIDSENKHPYINYFAPGKPEKPNKYEIREIFVYGFICLSVIIIMFILWLWTLTWLKRK